MGTQLCHAVPHADKDRYGEVLTGTHTFNIWHHYSGQTLVIHIDEGETGQEKWQRMQESDTKTHRATVSQRLQKMSKLQYKKAYISICTYFKSCVDINQSLHWISHQTTFGSS